MDLWNKWVEEESDSSIWNAAMQEEDKPPPEPEPEPEPAPDPGPILDASDGKTE